MPLHWSDLHEEVMSDTPRIVAAYCRICGEPLPVFCVEEQHSDLCEECEQKGDDDASL